MHRTNASSIVGQLDVDLHAVSKNSLEDAERALLRELGDVRGLSYAQRQAIALNLLRVMLERQIREAERRIGYRSERG